LFAIGYRGVALLLDEKVSDEAAADSDGGQRRWRFGSDNNSTSHSIFISNSIIIISIITISHSSSSRRSNRRLRGRLIHFARACRALLGLESGVASAWRLARRCAEAIGRLGADQGAGGEV